MKKLTDPRLRKLTADAIAEAKRKGNRHEVSLDGQGGNLVAYASGKASIVLRPRIGGKTAKLTYKGPPLTAAGVVKWFADRRAEIAGGNDPRAAKRAANEAAQLAAKDSLRSVCEGYLTLQER